jgi:hypothetical protein
MENEKIAMEVLKNIAMDPGRVLVERQRAIDALTLFRESAIPALQYIERKTDMDVLRQRSSLYIGRIRKGAAVTMTL